MQCIANNRTGSRTGRVPIVIVICIAFVMTGCASNRSGPLRDFESMSIQSKTRPADGLHAQADKDAAKRGGKIGAGGGAATGALVAAGCGPFFLFCLPVTTVIGAGAGAIAGSTAGVVGDAVDKLPRDTAERVEAILVEIEDRRDFFVEIRDGVSGSVPQDRQADLKAAKAAIYVGPEKIELVQTESSHLALRVTATLYAEWNRDKRTPSKDQRLYTKMTAKMPVDYWLSNDGAAFDEGFTECIEEIVQRMTWDLAPPDR